MNDLSFLNRLLQCGEHLGKLSSQQPGINQELEVQGTKLAEVAEWYERNKQHLSEWVA